MARLLACLRSLAILAFLALGAPLPGFAGQTAPLTFHTAKGSFAFSVEIADTDAAREKGLMFRTELAPDAGMIFDFRQTQPVYFWMQNTLIPLDMVFVSAEGVVAGVHSDAQPMDRTIIPSPAPVRFVVEVAGGRAAAIGLAPGDRMDFARVVRAGK